MNAALQPATAEELGILVKATQAVLHQRMDEVLRPLGLSVPQYVCLQTLSDTPGITGSDLARRIFVSRQSMNVLIHGLEKRGLVIRSDEPGPRRERWVDLTPAATPLLRTAHTAVGTVAQLMAAPLDQSERDRLRAALLACQDALLAIK